MGEVSRISQYYASFYGGSVRARARRETEREREIEKERRDDIRVTVDRLIIGSAADADTIPPLSWKETKLWNGGVPLVVEASDKGYKEQGVARYRE